MGVSTRNVHHWNRYRSHLEEVLVEALKNAKEALTISELVERMREIDSAVLVGESPEKSLYSVIFRRDKRRIARNQPPLIKKTQRGKTIFYELAEEYEVLEVGGKIEKR